MATAHLSVESKDFTLPVVEATAGADGIVVSTLRNDGWVTLDPGFLTTAQCESKITYIDGLYTANPQTDPDARLLSRAPGRSRAGCRRPRARGPT